MPAGPRVRYTKPACKDKLVTGTVTGAEGVIHAVSHDCNDVHTRLKSESGLHVRGNVQMAQQLPTRSYTSGEDVGRANGTLLSVSGVYMPT